MIEVTTMTSAPCGLIDSPRNEALPKRSLHRRLRAERDDPASFDDRTLGRHHASPGGERLGLPRNLVGLQVVVVEDDADSLEYFAAALRACGATVMTAATAFEGLALVRDGRPDVVLSDIAMVGYDGYWLVNEIRRLGEGDISRIPVVATTAYGEHSRARTRAAGFAELLPKPVDPETLCLTIAKVTGR
jgi:CheY-like chemotaxis protein